MSSSQSIDFSSFDTLIQISQLSSNTVLQTKKPFHKSTLNVEDSDSEDSKSNCSASSFGNLSLVSTPLYSSISTKHKSLDRMKTSQSELPQLTARQSIDLPLNAFKPSNPLKKKRLSLNIDGYSLDKLKNLIFGLNTPTSTESKPSVDYSPRNSLDVVTSKELTLFPKFNGSNVASSIDNLDLPVASRSDSIPIKYYKFQVYVNIDHAQCSKSYTMYYIRVQRLLLATDQQNPSVIIKRYSDFKKLYIKLVVNN
jgi:hypothetical protein